MKKNKFFTLSAIAIMFAGGIISCKKKKDPPASYDVSALNAMYGSLKTTPQEFNVPVGVHKTIIGTDSTIISFYPNSFKDKNGNIITLGTVNIKLVEMYRPGQMIANRSSTMVKSSLLKSGGQIYIKATMDGQDVYANRYQVFFKQPTTSSDPMYLFHEDRVNDDEVVRWEIADTSRQKGYGVIATAALIPDSINTGDTIFAWAGSPFYQFDSTSKFGWTNCDRFYYTTARTGLSVVLPDNTYTPGNTQIFLVLPAINAVMASDAYYLGGAQYDAATKTMKLSSEGATADLVPLGMAYKVVVLANKGGSYYYYETSGTISENLQVTASMSPVTLSTLQANLKAL